MAGHDSGMTITANFPGLQVHALEKQVARAR